MKDWRAELEASALPSLSIDEIRGRLISRARVSPTLLARAFKTLEEGLEAKEKHFFSFQGHVTEEHETIDHATRLNAVDKIFTMSGVYPNSRDGGKAAPSIAMEVDPRTGVVRIVVGGKGGDSYEAEGIIPQSLSLTVNESQLPLFNNIEHPSEESPEANDKEPEEVIETVKFKSRLDKPVPVSVASHKKTRTVIEDVKMPDYIWKMLNGK